MTNLEELTAEIQELNATIDGLREIVKGLADSFPYPDFEDADGSCFYCGTRLDNPSEHDSLCLWRRANEAN